MYLCYCDETNLNPEQGEFFVYGGLAFSSNSALKLHSSIEKIRAAHLVPQDYILKFNPGPPDFSHKQFIDLKEDVIQAAIDTDCVLMLSTILHGIATSRDDARRKEINRIVYHYHCVLCRPNCRGPGLVLIDRFQDKEIDAQLRDRFAFGLRGMPFSDRIKLTNIIGIHYSAIGQAHFPSIADVILGSVRFAFNSLNNPKHEKTAKHLMKLVSPLLFREQGDTEVSELGMFFSPKTIKMSKYRARYVALKNFLADCGVDTAQEIVSR